MKFGRMPCGMTAARPSEARGLQEGKKHLLQNMKPSTLGFKACSRDETDNHSPQNNALLVLIFLI